MLRKIRLMFALLFVGAYLLAVGAAAYAQSFPPLDGVVGDDTGQLDAGRVNSAAAALQDLQVKPLAVLVQNQTNSDNDAFARQVGSNYGYISGGANGVVDPDFFAIIVSLNQRQLTLLYGDNLVAALEGTNSSGQQTAANIRSRMGPLLAAALSSSDPQVTSDKLSEAFETGFSLARDAIDLYRNPPTSTPRPTVGPTNTPQPTIITNVDTSGIGTAFLWGLGIVILVIALAIFGPMLWRAWKKSQEAAARKQALREQLTQARNVAADMITDLEFPADPAEQLQYRFLALALGNERPEELSQLRARYGEMYQRVSGALARYDAVNQAKYTTDEELTSGIAQYQGIQNDINAAATFLKEIAERSRQVEGQIASAPAEVDEAKKALAAATNSVERLAAATPDLYKADPSKVISKGSDLLASAENALNEQPGHPLSAYDAATSAHSLADKIAEALKRVGAAYASLGSLREAVSGYRKGGFKLSQWEEQDAHTLSLLSRSVKGLEAGEKADAFNAVMQSAEESLTKARSDIQRLVDLNKSNVAALVQVKTAGEQLREYIDQGAQAFDKVDEYAESSWSDIRGNGTEAQKAAMKAQELWEAAGNLNALTPDGEQDFDKAAALAGEASGYITEARKLISAIIERLKNVEESKRIASAEIAAARHDIEAGQSYIAQYDRDITPRPSDMLKDAANLLEQAEGEAAKEKPDWIDVVRQVRMSNDMADKALAEARSQEDAMNAIRLKVSTAAQQAAAGISKVANFIDVHRSDIDPGLLRGIDDSQNVLRRTQARLDQTNRSTLEDAALAKTLDEIAGLFGEVQSKADQVFAAAQQQFQAMENLRGQATGAIYAAQRSIEAANFYISMHDSSVNFSTKSLLREARIAIPQLRDGASASELNQVIAAANQALALAERVNQKARADVSEAERIEAESEWQDQQSNWGGSIFGGWGSSGSSSSSSGGGWSWGGGSSSHSGGSSWGSGSSGGSSSHSWGGGGSSSSGFGGGRSSSGGFGKGGSSSGGW